MDTFPSENLHQALKYLMKKHEKEGCRNVCPNALSHFQERTESASVGVWCQEAVVEGAL